MGSLALLAALPDGLNRNTIETILIGLLAVCGLGVVVVLRTVQKLAVRVVLVLLLVAVGGALWWQRSNLAECKQQCTCRLFGQDVRVPDVANLNPQCRQV